MNVAAHIELNKRRFPHQHAIIFNGISLTYSGLDELACRFANALEGLGIGRGDRVALYLPNSPEFIFCYLGTLKLGAVAVSVNCLLKTNEVDFILRDCSARAIITSAALAEHVPDGADMPAHHLITIDVPAERGIELRWLLNRAAPHFCTADMQQDDPAAIVYTSGTTGFPKGATLSHGNIIFCMVAKNHYCQTRPHDRILLNLPLFHCFGQNAILNNGLNAGATLVIHQRFDPERTLRSLGEDNITMLFGVPTVFIKLMELQPPQSAFQSVRYCFTAGAPMPRTVAAAWQERYGLPIYEGYGLTETSPFASYNHADSYRAGSIGQPIQGVDMRTVDEHGHPLPPGVRGELVIRGPNVMLGYWNRPEATASAIRNGWFHTGDLGMMDEDGYFFVLDRLKDMINVSGFKIYPAEVETVISAHPSIAEVAVYGRPDPVRGEAIHASVVPRAGHTISEPVLQQFCRAQIAAFKVPHYVHIVPSLPKNATGKVLRRVLVHGE